ncbi:diguanylate cyclase [Pseudomonas sp. CAU 1711]|uniref:diguanylate cyclase n=1 Tax=Pseudomonas sp. CAU 1711 TaxID=3140356 RepID=UPI003261B298
MNVSGLEQVKLLTLLENANIGVVIHAQDTSIVYANPTALRLLRLTYNQIIGKDALDPQWRFLDEHNLTLPVTDYPVNRVLSSQQPLHNEVLGVLDSHHQDISWFSVNAYCEGDFGSGHGFIVVSFVDITDKKSLFSFEDILHNTQDIVIVTEADQLDRPLGPKIVYVNKAFEQLTGYSAEEVLGETPRLLQGQDTDAATTARIRAALERREPCQEKILNYSKSGQPYWLELHIIPLKNRFGDVTHFAAIERDVTLSTHYEAALEQRNRDLRSLKSELQNVLNERTEALRQSNAQLLRMAHEDPLTGLANRKAFFEQSEQQLARMRRGNSCLGVAILDVDNFKRINDEHGHDIGDQALLAVAKTLRHTLRQEDILGRLGGEEFAVSMLCPNRRMAEESLNRLREAIEQTGEEQPYAPLTVSIGLSFADAQHPQALGELLKQADMALYQAKRDGRNRLCCHASGEPASGFSPGSFPEAH